jgi:hypothetical protein
MGSWFCTFGKGSIIGWYIPYGFGSAGAGRGRGILIVECVLRIANPTILVPGFKPGTADPVAWSPTHFPGSFTPQVR